MKPDRVVNIAIHIVIIAIAVGYFCFAYSNKDDANHKETVRHAFLYTSVFIIIGLGVVIYATFKYNINLKHLIFNNFIAIGIIIMIETLFASSMTRKMRRTSHEAFEDKTKENEITMLDIIKRYIENIQYMIIYEFWYNF
jgi:hypothetical protein